MFRRFMSITKSSLSVIIIALEAVLLLFAALAESFTNGSSKSKRRFSKGRRTKVEPHKTQFRRTLKYFQKKCQT